LLYRQWHSRAWIIQEASATGVDKYPTAVWCGHKRQRWQHFVDISYRLNHAMKHVDDAKFRRIITYRYNELQNLKERRDKSSHNTAPLDLFHLINMVPTYEATDPRDKIYAILSIAHDGRHEALRPNYELPVEDVYLRFASHMITQHNNLDILGYCFLKRNLPLPSWVADWTQMASSFALPRRNLDNLHFPMAPPYDACRGRAANVEFLNEGRTLVVKGLVLDVVS